MGTKEVTDVLEGQLLYNSDPSVEQKRKYVAMANLGSESDSAALVSNICWLGVSSNLQKLLEYFFKFYYT